MNDGKSKDYKIAAAAFDADTVAFYYAGLKQSPGNTFNSLAEQGI